MIKKIISGGQTGADQGGLAAAVILGLKTGGTAPKGYRTQAGSAYWLKKLGVVEHASPNYPPRTKQNILDSDGTLIFGDITSKGCALTQNICEDESKPYIHIPWKVGEVPTPSNKEEFTKWIKDHNISVLNVAGNREESQAGIFTATYQFLLTCLHHS